SVAHFCVQVESASDAHLVDWIVFRESQEDGEVYASFSAPELLPFLKYYATLLLDNMARRRAPDVNILDL
ncbi:TPA: HEPN family nuclease, partial [Escherichia coli]